MPRETTKTTPEEQALKQITVRLIEPEEREEFDRVLEEQHYLHSARLGGQSLRYVAELDGQWMALVSFSAPALNVKAREKWIGWSPRRRARRLSLVVNNSRFLILPDRQAYPNLASRVLSLCLKRLSDDFQHHWGHPVLVVESFVDGDQYRGTCYRACGFEEVGCSSGYGRGKRDFYFEHGRPKRLFLRELRRAAAAILRRPRLPKELAPYEEDITGPCPLRAPQLGSLLKTFKTIQDPRWGHGLRHRQAFVLSAATVAMLMGAGGYQAFEDVCRRLTNRQLKALGCSYNRQKKAFVPPSDTTFFRVLSGIDPAAFDQAIGQWMMEQDPSVLETLAVDGKVLRGSGRSDGQPLQLLSAVSHRLRLTVAQEPVQDKSNEIPALKPLLEKLPLGQSLITADAMHCQQESARFITQQLGGDYLFGLKGNQSGILERAQSKLAEDFFSPGV